MRSSGYRTLSSRRLPTSGRATPERYAASCSPLSFPASSRGRSSPSRSRSGDYITPLLIGSGSGTNLIGNVIYDNIGLANNLPFAAALAVVPIVIMIFYLLGARALGAFEAM